MWELNNMVALQTKNHSPCKIELRCYSKCKTLLFEGDSIRAYSICVDAYDVNGVLYDRFEMDNVTTIEKTAEELIELLRRNRVTPISAGEVLEDFLACN